MRQMTDEKPASALVVVSKPGFVPRQQPRHLQSRPLFLSSEATTSVLPPAGLVGRSTLTESPSEEDESTREERKKSGSFPSKETRGGGMHLLSNSLPPGVKIMFFRGGGGISGDGARQPA